MISEGSCDAEDWSNDAENSALITGINYILKYTRTRTTCGPLANSISNYIIQSDLKWDCQVDHMMSSANRKLFALLQLKKFGVCDPDLVIKGTWSMRFQSGIVP